MRVSARKRMADGGEQEIWTAKNVADLVRASPAWVYRSANSGVIPAYKFAGRWRFDPNVIREWYRQQTAPRAVGR